jgi:hypothetical protein
LTLLAGSFAFKVDEIEVFEMIKEKKDILTELNEIDDRIQAKRINDDEIKDPKRNKYQGSDLINYPFINQISIILNDKSEWRMIYKGTKDGFKPRDFHGKCDDHSNTITIISANNHTFGGFTSIPWHSRGGYSYDPNAFLFSFDTKSNELTKYNQDGKYHSNKDSIYGYSSFGPIFGSGHDVNLFFLMMVEKNRFLFLMIAIQTN